MSGYAKSKITAFEGSTLAQARAIVINAFAEGNHVHTLKMLRVFYISTGKQKIIEECNKTYKEISQEIAMYNTPIKSYAQDHISKIEQRNRHLEERNMDFYEKIMMLIAAAGWTEFDQYGPISDKSFEELEEDNNGFEDSVG